MIATDNRDNMIRTTAIRSLVCLLAALLPGLTTTACTIFMANDGSNVWSGNNEDESPLTKYRFCFFPAGKGQLGYMLWSELQEGYESIMHLHPQGGLNEKGLFMDYTAIDPVAVIPLPSRTNREQEVINDLLRNFSTVAEALSYLSAFNLIRLEGAQLFLADASGDYATVHCNYTVHRSSLSFALTNYNITAHPETACWRRDAVTRQRSAGNQTGLTAVQELLQKSAQQYPGPVTTNYSMAINLNTSTVFLFGRQHLETFVQIDLKDALQNGTVYKDLDTYFPFPDVNTLYRSYTAGGINPIIQQYRQQLPADRHYTFRKTASLQLAARLMADSTLQDALAPLEAMAPLHPNDPDVQSWLAIARMLHKDERSAGRIFRKVLQQYPDHTAANLFGNQHKDTITFRLPECEAAQTVQLIGGFTGWLRDPIFMTRQHGYWHASVALPKGIYQYKFLVNGTDYIADLHNLLVRQEGDNYNSVLYVW